MIARWEFRSRRTKGVFSAGGSLVTLACARPTATRLQLVIKFVVEGPTVQ